MCPPVAESAPSFPHLDHPEAAQENPNAYYVIIHKRRERRRGWVRKRDPRDCFQKAFPFRKTEILLATAFLTWASSVKNLIKLVGWQQGRASPPPRHLHQVTDYSDLVSQILVWIQCACPRRIAECAWLCPDKPQTTFPRQNTPSLYGAQTSPSQKRVSQGRMWEAMPILTHTETKLLKRHMVSLHSAKTELVLWCSG